MTGFHPDEVARVSGYAMYVVLGAHHVMWALTPGVTYDWWHGNMHSMYKSPKSPSKRLFLVGEFKHDVTKHI